MSICDTPILAKLRTRMLWRQERQRVLAENAAATPKYRARDLAPPDFRARAAAASLGLERTDSHHIAAGGEGGCNPQGSEPHREVRPGGNAVSHEDEMLSSMDHNAVTSRALHDTVEIDQPARALPRCRGNYHAAAPRAPGTRLS